MIGTGVVVSGVNLVVGFLEINDGFRRVVKVLDLLSRTRKRRLEPDFLLGDVESSVVRESHLQNFVRLIVVDIRDDCVG